MAERRRLLKGAFAACFRELCTQTIRTPGNIMSVDQYSALQRMLPPRRGDWTLMHDTARDGGVGARQFHVLCDGKGEHGPQ